MSTYPNTWSILLVRLCNGPLLTRETRRFWTFLSCPAPLPTIPPQNYRTKIIYKGPGAIDIFHHRLSPQTHNNLPLSYTPTYSSWSSNSTPLTSLPLLDLSALSYSRRKFHSSWSTSISWKVNKNLLQTQPINRSAKSLTSSVFPLNPDYQLNTH